MRTSIFGFLKRCYQQRGLHLPPLRKEAEMSSVSTSPFCICLETGNHLKAVRKGELAESGWREKWG